MSDTCSQCEDYPPEMDQVVVAVDFVQPWSDLIGELKFQDTPAVAHTLTRLLAQAVWQAARQHKHPTPDLIVPIPLSDHRWHERGYNQAWLLAQGVSRQLGWGSRLRPHTLVRQHDTGRLMSMLADERERRIKQAFRVCADKRHQVEGQHVVMVDDVMTTGATANEAARTLLAAGAASVTGWFAARTPTRSRQALATARCPAQ
ncbi:MAG: ComF family protein [Burkholderiales bacterium]|nr:ComF family protein [Burkholderiales bacterium]